MNYFIPQILLGVVTVTQIVLLIAIGINFHNEDSSIESRRKLVIAYGVIALLAPVYFGVVLGLTGAALAIGVGIMVGIAGGALVAAAKAAEPEHRAADCPGHCMAHGTL
ncbi:MAG: hypothetical protein LBH13_10430 [Cellulomonadaceae bacterium]|jgi:hypothetical protein|nr:hypothetical protein [Cellulomonadaceae bacterium]